VRAHRAELVEAVASRTTQTNEVARSAVLLLAYTLVAERTGRPLALLELGASAGLNLRVDRWCYDYGAVGMVGDPAAPIVLRPEVRGDTAPPLGPRVPEIVWRLGLDHAPIDVRDPDATDWLRACIWPEHHERAARLEAALAAAATDPPPVRRGDIVTGLLDALAGAPDDTALVVSHSNVVGYLAMDRRAELADHLRAAAHERPLWVVSCEGVSIVPEITTLVPPGHEWQHPSVLLGLSTLHGDDRRNELLAFAHPHGNWLRWVG
jgi:hypothetical protein